MWSFAKFGLIIGIGTLVGCQGALEDLTPKAEREVPRKLRNKMTAMDMPKGSPILIRIFKQESALELWKQKTNGRYALLKTYDICKWSGKLGPKYKEGDRQAPEGFYEVKPYQMNPNSSYYLSFNMGFPNKFDRSRDRTGTFLMIHGACSSAGCYSMTDEQIAEIYASARDTFSGGQKAFQIQAYPFRMTAENMFKNREDKSFEFWRMLKVGYDHFESTKLKPNVEVCGKNYRFNVFTDKGKKFKAKASCPPLYMSQGKALAYMKVKKREDAAFEKLLARSEGREIRDPGNFSFATALPGIQVVSPKSARPPVKTALTN